MAVRSETAQTITIHQKLVNKAGVIFDPIDNSSSRLVFFQVSIEQVWDSTDTEADSQVFQFVRQAQKLDGTPTPEIRVTTFTNYDQANPEGDLELVTEFVGYEEESGPQHFFVESDATSLSLVFDYSTDLCLACDSQRYEKVIQRKVYIRDPITQDFISYLEEETLSFTVIIEDCANDFVLGEEPRLQIV